MNEIVDAHWNTLAKQERSFAFRAIVGREILRILPLLPDGFDSEKLGWHFFSQVDLLRLVHCVIHENQFRTGELKSHINNAGAKLYSRLLTEEPALFDDIKALIGLISPLDLDDTTLDASLKKLAHRELMLKKPGF
ncbi:MAG: hypothetical protein MJH10_03035, partial [Epibacterium sp.]|nr:hypothetical protein [Epibacterium sp.]NQX72529.1 hypothetical protein [Epibacterium sp.]